MGSKLKTLIAIGVLTLVVGVALFWEKSPFYSVKKPSLEKDSTPKSFGVSLEENRPTPFPVEVQKKMLEVVEPADLTRGEKEQAGIVATADFIWRSRNGKEIYYHLDLAAKSVQIRNAESGSLDQTNCRFDQNAFEETSGYLRQVNTVCKYDYYKKDGKPCAPARFPAWLVLNWGTESEIRFGERNDHCALDIQPCGLKLRNQLKVSSQSLMSSVSCE